MIRINNLKFVDFLNYFEIVKISSLSRFFVFQKVPKIRNMKEKHEMEK